MKATIEQIKSIALSPRIHHLKQEMFQEEQVVSVEQAKWITKAYQEHEEESIMMKRAYALSEAANNLEIVIHKGELIVGNRSAQSCAGIVFPEGGIKWLEKEMDDLETRPQDRFKVRAEDRASFFNELLPYWKGKTLEEQIDATLPQAIKELEIVGKLNQKDHAQGHICPDVPKWLAEGPKGLLEKAKEKLESAAPSQREYFKASIIVLEAACNFIKRYALLAMELAEKEEDVAQRLEFEAIASVCNRLAEQPADGFYEALQSMWFLIVLMQMESNASSFSPGRADQYLYPYFEKDRLSGKLDFEKAQEMIDAVFVKFNQIVYLRNSKGAEFFAGFPIGFNISIGGQKADGSDAVNELSYMFLQAQEHVSLRQPNLSARIHKNSPDAYIRRVAEVIGLGTGMPQLFNDESVIPAMEKAGYAPVDAINYAVVGCVELSTQGNALGFSDASMFNMVKALELTLNNGRCMQTGKQFGLALGDLTDFKTYEDLELAFAKQLSYFIEKMEKGMQIVEEAHKNHMPSPFLSSVIEDCFEKGKDVTAGGARYNMSGVQLIQVANVADSLAALKELLYDKGEVSAEQLLENLRNNYQDEKLRLIMLNHAPKYGNDIAWVDEIGEKWIEFFKAKLDSYKNYRGGDYTIGLYTVSAHVPMGANVGATPDGRRSGEPLADGGLSAVYGRDQNGPTALLRSVSRIDTLNAANGTLLNMKFAPQLFETDEGIDKFCGVIRAFSALGIGHVQFNVVNKQDLISAKANPEKHRHLLVRVAGYTANYVDLAHKLQDEIIARTEYGA